VIGDYSETAGGARQWADDTNHAQLGNPVKGAQRLSRQQPVQNAGEIALGTDCLVQVEAKLANVAMEMKRWRSLAESTDYQEKSESPAA